MPNHLINNQNTLSNESNSTLSQELVIAVKKWIYELCQKLISSNTKARRVAFQSVLWLEYLSLYNSTVSLKVRLNPKYAQLYALICVNTVIQQDEELRKIYGYAYTEKSLISLAFKNFPQYLVLEIQSNIDSLDLPKLVTKKSILYDLEDLLCLCPQDRQIHNVCLILLDSYNLKYIGYLAAGTNVACAVLAVARFWVLESDSSKWLPEYVIKTGFYFTDFYLEWTQIHQLALEINQRNLEEKRKLESQALNERKN
jgi:hypothetical protein